VLRASLLYVEAFALASVLGWLIWGWFWSTQQAQPEFQMAGYINLAIGSALAGFWVVTRLLPHLKEAESLILENMGEIALLILGIYLYAWLHLWWGLILCVLGAVGMASSLRGED